MKLNLLKITLVCLFLNVSSIQAMNITAWTESWYQAMNTTPDCWCQQVASVPCNSDITYASLDAGYSLLMGGSIQHMYYGLKYIFETESTLLERLYGVSLAFAGGCMGLIVSDFYQARMHCISNSE